MKQKRMHIESKNCEPIEERAARMVEAADKYNLPVFTYFNGIRLTALPASSRAQRIVKNYQRKSARRLGFKHYE
jgi:hypothetical protein